jgi:SPOR domain
MTTDIERGGIDVGGSHEPSYYEIALTNRQVVVAFVVLLTCVVAAFFSGVWIGRESAARAQERLALLARANPVDGANAAADRGKQEGQALQEFKFFADSRRHPEANAKGGKSAAGTAGAKGTVEAAVAAPANAAAVARGDAGGGSGGPSGRSTLADDLGQRAGSSTAGSTAGAAPRPAAGAAAASSSSGAAKRARRDRAASPGQAAPSSPAPADSEAAGEGEALPGTPAPAPAARAARGSRANASSGTGAAAAGGGKPAISWSAAGATPAGASTADGESGARAGAQSSGVAAAGDVVIQVFSTADKEQADKVRDGLVHAGFTAFLSPIAKGGQTMYRVRIGPFPSRTAAEPVAEKVRKQRKLDTWITPNK